MELRVGKGLKEKPTRELLDSAAYADWKEKLRLLGVLGIGQGRAFNWTPKMGWRDGVDPGTGYDSGWAFEKICNLYVLLRLHDKNSDLA